MRIFEKRNWFPWSVAYRLERENAALRQELEDTQKMLLAERRNAGPPFMAVAREMDQKVADAIGEQVKEHIARKLEPLLMPHVMDHLTRAWNGRPYGKPSPSPSALIAMDAMDMECAVVRFTLPEVSTEVQLLLDCAS